jgi:hypothetical protein
MHRLFRLIGCIVQDVLDSIVNPIPLISLLYIYPDTFPYIPFAKDVSILPAYLNPCVSMFRVNMPFHHEFVVLLSPRTN